jgi:sulfide:quinone oxidoreductase
MREIVVLGGGFGGLEAVNRLRKTLGPEHRIILVDKKDKFYMGLAKLWIVAGERTEAECYTDMRLITKNGINHVKDDVIKIEPKSQTVETAGSEFRYDFLIIALGANLSPQLVNGFENGFDLYDIGQAERIHQRLQKMQRGIVSIIIAKPPFKCPPAPYEAAFLIDAFLRKQNKREKISIRIFTPEPQPLALLGKTVGDKMKYFLEERDIEYHPNTKLNQIKEKSAVFDSGEFQSELTLLVPPHVVPSVIKSSGLVEGEWLEVDKKTLKTKFDRVYAIGDCAGVKLANGMLLPKAGVLAEVEAQVVAGNISAELTGSPRQEFNGKGYCFIEVGFTKATTVEADFFAAPNPVATPLAEPSEEFKRRKIEFERERIARWFF